MNQFSTEIQSFLETAASFHDYANQPEAFYHGFMLALISSMMDHFYVSSNEESGFGRPNMILIPKDKAQNTAFILEFKPVHHGESAQSIAEARLAQIQAKNYGAKIRQYDYITRVLELGIAFDGKKVICASADQDLRL